MDLEQILAIITPIISGATGIIGALIIFVGKIKSLRREVKSQLTDTDIIKNELDETRQAVQDLTLKINFIVEEAKKNGKKS